MALPRIHYTRHARDRMRQRGVRAEDVQVTLSVPDETVDTPEGSRRFVRTMVDDRTLKVWIVLPQDGDLYIVKSVAWKGEDDE